MKGALVLCLISALLPCLDGYTCAQCQFGDLKCTATCTGSQCIEIQETSPTVKPNDNGTYRGCTTANPCKPISITLRTFSDRRFQSTTACCESDNCNSNLTLSEPPTGDNPNGVNCPVCEAQDKGQCTNNGYITCKGLEEKCITLAGSSLDEKKAQNFSLKGCASRNACNMLVNDIIAFKGIVYKLDANAACTDRGTLSALSSPAAIFLPAMVGYFLVNSLPDL